MVSLTRRNTLGLLGWTALAMPFVKRARAEGGELYIYNWADYIGETTIEDFQSATGISVTYDTYSSSEEMEAKLLAGNTGYDLMDIAGLNLPRFLKAGLFLKLDRSKLPSWKNLDPEVLRILGAWDPGNAHGLPYMWGSVGFTYNLDLVKERIPDADLASLDLLLKPENAARLSDCGISVLDSPTDVILFVLKYMGRDPDKATAADYQAAADVIKPIRQYIRTFDNANYINALPNKELCMVNSWSGDYSTARARAEEAGITDLNLAYVVPKTGAPAWADAMCIPSDARNVESAHTFLEYLLQPEVIAKCSNITNYANGNLASKPFIDPAILANPAVYPDDATKKLLWAPAPLTDEQSQAITRIWTEMKAG